MPHTIIIGNGISGVTAARHIRKLSDQTITIISSETDHFYSRTALMYIYMGHMRFEDTKPYEDWFWDKNNINLINATVTEIYPDNNRLRLDDGKQMNYDNLVLALGSKPNKFGWPGQDADGVSGLYHIQDLYNMERYSDNLKRAVIVGGGLIGIEMAEMFRSRDIDVTMLVREESYWDNVLPIEESKMVSQHIMKHHIDLRLGVNLAEISTDNEGKVKSVAIKETGEKINCGYVGLTAGVSPNIGWIKGMGIDTDRGIVVNEYLQTNHENIYAIGDCAQLKNPIKGRKPIEAVWYTGRMMGETVAKTICGKSTSYNPGVWFNSAKFIDIEYQIYGDVPAKPRESISSLFWSHPDGEKSIRINYQKTDKVVVGFNLLGIRYRHKVCEKWIVNKLHIEEVLQNLKLANFDPEFYEMYEKNIIESYNKQEGKNIRSKSRRSLNSVLSFLALNQK